MNDYESRSLFATYVEEHDLTVDAKIDDLKEAIAIEDACARGSEVLDTLTYNSYRWQREFYGIAASRLAPHFPRADKYEECYQEELARRAA